MIMNYNITNKCLIIYTKKEQKQIYDVDNLNL